jgi:hypothetical protein
MSSFTSLRRYAAAERAKSWTVPARPRANSALTRLLLAFCLAVMCLLYMVVVLALKPTMSSRAVQDAAALHTITSVASISDRSGAFPVANTSSNADRSPTAPSVDAVEKVAAEESKIASVATDSQTPPTSAATKPEVVGWHWRVWGRCLVPGYSTENSSSCNAERSRRRC